MYLNYCNIYIKLLLIYIILIYIKELLHNMVIKFQITKAIHKSFLFLYLEVINYIPLLILVV